MTDLNKLRSEFESNEYIKSIIQNFEWSEEFNNYQIKDCVINGNIFDLLEAKNDEQLLNGAWFGWQEKAKAQAVQQSFEIGRLQDRITELLDERQDLYAQINNDQAVPEWISVEDRLPEEGQKCLVVFEVQYSKDDCHRFMEIDIFNDGNFDSIINYEDQVASVALPEGSSISRLKAVCWSSTGLTNKPLTFDQFHKCVASESGAEK